MFGLMIYIKSTFDFSSDVQTYWPHDGATSLSHMIESTHRQCQQTLPAQHVMPLLRCPQADTTIHICKHLSCTSIQVGVVLNQQEQQVKNRKPHVCCNISHTVSLPAHPQYHVKTWSHHHIPWRHFGSCHAVWANYAQTQCWFCTDILFSADPSICLNLAVH